MYKNHNFIPAIFGGLQHFVTVLVAVANGMDPSQAAQADLGRNILFTLSLPNSVSPVFRDHSREVMKVVSYSGWSLNAGSFRLI